MRRFRRFRLRPESVFGWPVAKTRHHRVQRHRSVERVPDLCGTSNGLNPTVSVLREQLCRGRREIGVDEVPDSNGNDPLSRERGDGDPVQRRATCRAEVVVNAVWHTDGADTVDLQSVVHSRLTVDRGDVLFGEVRRGDADVARSLLAELAMTDQDE